MFTDLQNFTTARAVTDYLPPVLAKHPQDVRLVFRHVLLSIHPLCEPAAEVALEARAEHGEEAFWRVATTILESPIARNSGSDMNPMLEAAKIENLDMIRVRTAIATRKYRAEIEADDGVAKSLGFGDRGPWFVIGNEVIMGAPSTESMEWVINRQRAPAPASTHR
jgi:protein-disulfide isomerase